MTTMYDILNTISVDLQEALNYTYKYGGPERMEDLVSDLGEVVQKYRVLLQKVRPPDIEQEETEAMDAYYHPDLPSIEED